MPAPTVVLVAGRVAGRCHALVFCRGQALDRGARRCRVIADDPFDDLFQDILGAFFSNLFQ
ncbi:hypothetical protein JQ557_14320 [Bradyrhizobium sp. U87765 SZCCT0131]|uniref:hypothetical protein n=1 Tax=unclassified Bradyrhizobium TaxID=2631580 RepID=UPI001BA4C205|nr:MULTISPECIES: hypothetical protein [unclassified Bradyrhizobium]MBR1219175.1 hypothetical protein [Bradyrhizobium sp. U87765 SZCCT0131]MBR1261826.1 hypothetical protein [Bradyrhizobium sp. U87765 SZCCT0134]MBR1306321.1 hypothetical protein [Bradyrhizobium sp. U87765 SZCCT0110]MBR1317608.1 hypothetical protein [Bradyrhizobium sp. U87765 SZCCT0109]MBR1351310.1 hypothetical protein [Bradyrhizobium sp. U87765 SZCCT0048]